MNTSQLFGNRLKQLRGKAKQEELAANLGISRASVGYYENGARTPDIEILEKVADYFEVSYDYLMGKTNCAGSEAQDIGKLTNTPDDNCIVIYFNDGDSICIESDSFDCSDISDPMIYFYRGSEAVAVVPRCNIKYILKEPK